MSGSAMKWARRQNVASPVLKSVLRAVAERADAKGATWASQATLAEDMGVSVRSVRRNLACLEALGVIRRDKRYTRGKGRTSDEIRLVLHRDFDIRKSELDAVKKALSQHFHTGQKRPLSEGDAYRPKMAVHTGHGWPRNRKGIEDYPIQEEEISGGASELSSADEFGKVVHLPRRVG